METSKDKVKYILHLYHHQDDRYSLTWLAKQLNISKSTLSRILSGFYKEGLIEEKGKIFLSASGLKIAKQYQKEVIHLRDWLMESADFSKEEAYDEAMTLYATLSFQAKKKLMSSDCMNKFFHTIRDIKMIYGDMLTMNLDDGEYPFAFTVIKKNGMEISMANDGFVHPAILRVENGLGMFVFHAKEIEKKIKSGHMILKGKLSSLYYQDGKDFKLAQQFDQDFFIPVSRFCFYHSPEERILQTVLKIRVQASVSTIHMPESEALLTVIIK